jgi:molybdate transport system substrate-binding protein
MTSQTIAASLATLGAAMVMLAGIADAAELRVIGSPGTRAPYTQLVPGFEKATGNKVVTIWGA